MSMNRTKNMRYQLGLSGAILAVIGGAAFLLTRGARSQSRDAAPPSLTDAVAISHQGEQYAAIELQKVRAETLSGEIQAAGQICYPSDTTVKVSPRLAGRIRSVLVKVGDHVAAGQILATLDSVDAAAAQTTARQSENRLRLAKQTLERNERLYRLGTPEVTAALAALDQAHAATTAARDALDRIRQQAAIGGFAQPPLEAAQNSLIAARTALVQAQSDLAQAQRDRDRKAKLVEIGVAARSDLEAAENVLEKARIAATSDAESLHLAEQALEREQKAQRSNLYSEQQVRAAEAAWRQASLQETASERALRLAKAAILANLQQARSDYEAAANDAANAQHVLEMLGHPDSNGVVRVTAPCDGVITDRQVSPGQVVDQSQMTPWQMFVLSNVSRVWIDADVYEKDIAAVSAGQQVVMQVGALPGRTFHGSVMRIAPLLDKTTRAIKVHIEVANPDGALKDGMYASVFIYPGGGRRALTIPASAVQHDGDSDTVFVPSGGKYVRRNVDLGAHIKERYVVLNGLSEGETFVSHGAILLDSQAGGGH